MSEFGLKCMKGTDPVLLLALLPISHDPWGIDHCRQDEHTDAKYDKDES